MDIYSILWDIIQYYVIYFVDRIVLALPFGSFFREFLHLFDIPP